MSKISKTIFALAIGSMITVTSCRDTKTENDATDEHGHEHDANGGHMHNDTMEQEEFIVEKDSMEMKTDVHKHDDGAEHHDH